MIDATGWTPLAAAAYYLGRGWQPIPIKPRSKEPKLQPPPRWRAQVLGAADLPAHFPDSSDGWATTNVGILLGKLSGGLFDVDVDDEAMLPYADLILPRTATFGRLGRKRSHYLYLADRPVTFDRKVYPSPGKRVMAELRGNGCMTVFPPSVHASGQVVAWDDGTEPTKINPDKLIMPLYALEACALFLRTARRNARWIVRLDGIEARLRTAGLDATTVEEVRTRLRHQAGVA